MTHLQQRDDDAPRAATTAARGPATPEGLRIHPWICPMCTGGLTTTWDGTTVTTCLHCSGSGLTDDPCGPAELAPRPPAVMRTACADCALRRGSPELENAGVGLPYEEPFYCHQGLPVSATGRYQSVATFRGMPLGAMVCAGWWALRTGQPMPAAAYREIPITEDEVAKRWGPKPAGELELSAADAADPLAGRDLSHITRAATHYEEAAAHDY